MLLGNLQNTALYIFTITLVVVIQSLQYNVNNNQKNVTLTDLQKYKFCVYTRDNKGTRPKYVKWIENK
ncbi:17594_t:CDS:2 [Racocetra fulgida]|uniref:17594_t:CDS:1 n=1 Tax=Racocetra fulgida TaxID=60492 RepID=A0A9N9AQF4_9GLOM|nr:17594_t:CDS:2 [Racocetra fulgida]